MYRATLNIGARRRPHAIAPSHRVRDLFGKQLGVPVTSFSAGPCVLAPAYASWLYATEDLALAARPRRGRRRFTASQRLARPVEGKEGIPERRFVRTVDAVGPGRRDVMADAYMSWDAGYVRCIRAIEDAGIRLRWVDGP
jgi:L-alanine-DL-glutamate epimerase-like enolase superfamily enzyme